jgi:hypothetical protein
MNYQADWNSFYHPPGGDGLDSADQSDRPYGDFLLSPYPIDDESCVGGTLISPSLSLQAIPPLVGHVSFLSPDSFHDSTPKNDPKTHYLGEAVKIGMTFVSGYEFRVAKHTTNIAAVAHWSSNNQPALYAAAAEHLLSYSGISATGKSPPKEEKRDHILALNHVMTLLRNERLPQKVRYAFLSAMDVLHLSIVQAGLNPGLSVSLAVVSIEAGADCFFSGRSYKSFLKTEEQSDLDSATSFKQAFVEKHKGLLSDEEAKTVDLLVGKTKSFYKNSFYTKRKFLLFCEEHAPYQLWDALARHPYLEIPGGQSLVKPQSPFSATPSQMTEAELKTLLEETYAFRNKYVHCARQPDALATPSLDIYFETFFDSEEECVIRAIKPALIIGIARKALVSWLEQSLASSQPSAHPALLI